MGAGPRPAFSSVAVMVSDRARSVLWYTELLGLEVIENKDHWVTVGRAGHEGTIHLCQASDLPDLELEPGNTGIDLRGPGPFADVCAVWAERGVRFSRGPTRRPWGSYALLSDPDGNVLRVVPADPSDGLPPE
jgi:catechol 2,3-dioxygenase-like lactoylglutathione lyase family enzyme